MPVEQVGDGGYPGTGPRLMCPGRRRHPELHEQMEQKKTTIDYNGTFGTTMLPRTVIAELKKELAEDRDKFKKIKPDIIIEK